MTGRAFVGLTATMLGLALGLWLAACGPDEEDQVLPLADDTTTTTTAPKEPSEREEVEELAAEWAAAFAAGHPDACDHMTQRDCGFYVVGGEPSDFAASFGFSEVEKVELERNGDGPPSALVGFSNGRYVELQRKDDAWEVSDVEAREPGGPSGGE
jgi:hypothetical protein